MSRPTASSARRAAAPELRVPAVRIAEHGAACPSRNLLRLERECRRVETVDAEDRGVEIVVEEHRDRVERLTIPLDPRARRRDDVRVRQDQIVGDDEPGSLQDLVARRAGDQHERRTSVSSRLGPRAPPSAGGPVRREAAAARRRCPGTRSRRGRRRAAPREREGAGGPHRPHERRRIVAAHARSRGTGPRRG